MFQFSIVDFVQEAAWDSLLELITAGGALASNFFSRTFFMFKWSFSRKLDGFPLLPVFL